MCPLIYGHAMRHSRSHTKTGPGRYHGEGKLYTAVDKTRFVKQPERRFAVAIRGGSWKGKPYITYREHDRFVRQRLQQSDWFLQ